VVNETHVYARDFSKVKVLVNPTYDSYSMNLDANYETYVTNHCSPTYWDNTKKGVSTAESAHMLMRIRYSFKTGLKFADTLQLFG
jgi:hypothetical protein